MATALLPRLAALPRSSGPGGPALAGGGLAALCLVAGLLVPAATGQGIDPGTDGLEREHRDLSALTPTMDLTFAPDFLAFDIEWTSDVRQETCSPSRTNLEPANQRFFFNDSWADADCARFNYELPVPAGAELLIVAFTADREITEPFVQNDTDETPPVNIEMPQNFIHEYLGPDGQVVRNIYPYYDDTEGSQPAQEFVTRIVPPENVTLLRVVWEFDDRGTDEQEVPIPPLGIPQLENRTARPFGLQNPRGLDVTVQGISFTWVGAQVPYQVSPPSEEHVETRDAVDVGILDYNLTVDVPTAMLDPIPAGGYRNRATLHIPVATGPQLVGVVGPGGPLDANEYVIVEGQGRTQVDIPPETLWAHGPGSYELQYQSVRVIPPTGPPVDPERSYPLFIIIAFLPALAAALAVHQANAYVKQAEGAYRRSAYAVAIAVGLVVAYYVILLGYALFRIGPRTMATIPPERQVLLVDIQFILLLVMLSTAALAVSRTLIRSMRHDLAERARKEDQLRRSNEELERFAYVASHDLQEPLRKVAGFTALLQKKYGGKLDKDADEIIGYAVDGATRMQMLIKDILAYSRVGSKELQRVPVDVSTLMGLVTTDLGEPIRESKARVTWEPLPTVRADASQLRQVLQNLVENAVKYRHPKRRPAIHVSAREEPDAWVLSVRDNGIGIPADKHEEIFGIFRRLHGQDHPGTGIGLAVAKKAMERHGGRIWVESRVGKGSTFHLRIPRSALDDVRGLPSAKAASSSALPDPARGAAPA